MTEAFMGYSEDFEQCRDDAMADIRSIPKARDQRERDDLSERAQGNISEAERYMRILESESRAGDSQDRRRMHQQLRTFKSQLDKLKANLERSKLMDGSQQRRQAAAPQDNVARYQQRTDRIDDHLDDARPSSRVPRPRHRTLIGTWRINASSLSTSARTNRIRSLPPIMDRFSRLETLSLESNNISGQEVFSFIAIMPRLRNLNLSYNKITGFPESALTLEEKRGAGFYNLIYLNLAHNMITEEEAVVHTTELRSLRKLILYGNPLAHAAVTSYDPTKLAYDPVPSLTAILNERTADQITMTIMVAYPATKKKKLHSMSCYEHVEIYKMIPNEVVLQSPFHTRTTEFMPTVNPDTVTDKELLSKRQSDTPSTPMRRRSQRVDDALTELSHQVSSTWDRRPYSLITTANKLNLTYKSSPQGSGQTRKA
ncbi:hypothetical protein AM588_10005854 [Phytophthora nicotianae]|uniref:Vesicle transport v-SNARE N-terminal domain-containing protein n=1 Tax=Phytophthora nicotianae TaxID=4792 RepID=A0A0W8DIE6_PHYNI|nr:hypothetical protein AM588_10005854 [Phytophthora nicotianae]